MTLPEPRQEPAMLWSPRAAVSVSLLVAMPTLGACESAPPDLEGSGEGGAGWIDGTVDERFQQIGDQLAGFSQTMFEVGVRYEHLHWAVEDGNWDYAAYQVDKIEDAVVRGIRRRAGRAESAGSFFLGEPVRSMRAALESAGRVAVEEAFRDFTVACNECHVAESMEFVIVAPPEARSIPVQPPSGNP